MDSAAQGQQKSNFLFHEIYSSIVDEYTDDKDKPKSSKTKPKSLDVYADIVIIFKYKQPSKGVNKAEYENKTINAYHSVIQKLARVGLRSETRPHGDDTLFIFVLCPWMALKREATRISIHDWLAGIRVADTSETEMLLRPAKERDDSLDSYSESDRIRIICDMITGLPTEGGAGIYPGDDEYVESLLPLHEKSFNKSWIKSWSTKWIVDQDDLSKVRDQFGEKVAYYFEFLQFYFQWLAFPTGLGIFVHLFGSSFSIFYGVCVILWSIVFTESWKRREKELAYWWGVRHVSKTEMRRPEFKGERDHEDPVTGEKLPFFSPWKRWSRQLAGVPVILGGAVALATVITSVFGIEVFFTLYYDGYMKNILIYLPMVLYSLAIPNVASFCKSVAQRLTDYENYETRASHEYHLMQKVFIFNALTSYMSILLTAYIYIPFGPQLIATLQAYGIAFSSASIEASMLQNRLKAFMITTQAVSFGTETIVPWLTRRAMTGAAKIQKEVSEKLHHRDSSKSGFVVEDTEGAKLFLKRVAKQAELPVYDVNEDYAEMVLQFGYVSLFSVIWPLTGLCAFVNNFVELRSDAAKISFNARRPIPSRTDTIGPWIDNIQRITWFSSLTNASILYLFNGVGSGNQSTRQSLGMLLLWLLVSEHVYLGLRGVLSLVLKSIPTTAELNVRKKEFGVKSTWLTRLGEAIGNPEEIASQSFAKRSLNADVSLAQSSELENDIGVQAIRSNLKTT